MRTLPLSRRLVAAAASLTLLAAGGVVAGQSPTTAPAPTVAAGDIALTQNISLPTLRVGQQLVLPLDSLIDTLKRQYGYENATVTLTSITGLPAGLTWNRTTNSIEGTPTTAGVYTVTVSGRGCLGFICRSATQSADVTVNNADGTPPANSTPETPPGGTPEPGPAPTPGGAGSIDAGSLGGDTGSLAAAGSVALIGVGIAAALNGGLAAPPATGSAG